MTELELFALCVLYLSVFKIAYMLCWFLNMCKYAHKSARVHVHIFLLFQ